METWPELPADVRKMIVGVVRLTPKRGWQRGREWLLRETPAPGNCSGSPPPPRGTNLFPLGCRGLSAPDFTFGAVAPAGSALQILLGVHAMVSMGGAEIGHAHPTWPHPRRRVPP